MSISPETIKQIAEDLDMGLVCFYHKVTGKVESYPDESSNPGFDDEMWVDVIDKIEQSADDYIRIEPMSSHKSYKVMEAFINDISNISTRGRFLDAISRKKPFRQFDEQLFHYPDLREQWFAYKLAAYIKFVEEQVEETDC